MNTIKKLHHYKLIRESSIVSTEHGIQSSGGDNKPRFYYVESKLTTLTIPQKRKSGSEIEIEPKSKEPKIRNKPKYVDLVLFNTRGLITGKENKCRFILDTITHADNEFVLCITESWLQESHHNESEITHVFDSHHIHRSDRNISLASDGIDGEKSKQGGCITITKVRFNILDTDF